MSRDLPQPPPHAHACPYRVCYADTDCMGRVYYANYLVWFERARTELLRAAGLPYRQLEKAGAFLPVRACEVRYFGHTEYDDELILQTWISRLRHATVDFVTAVVRPPEPRILVVGRVELACITREGRPRPLPEEAAAALQRFLASEAP